MADQDYRLPGAIPAPTSDVSALLSMYRLPGATQAQSMAPAVTGLDPSLMLSAVGASSPSKTGDASNSVMGAYDPEPSAAGKLRTQAELLLQNAAKDSSVSDPAPQAQAPRYTPLETAIAAAIGGALNAASPFTSEGTKALNAYMSAKQSDAALAYQNEVAQHASAIQAARLGFDLARQQGAPLLDQANAIDQNDHLTARERFERQMAEEGQAAQSHEADLQRAHSEFLQDAKISGDQKLQSQKILLEKLVDVLAQTGPGRALLAAQAGVALGKQSGDVVQMSRVATLAAPQTIAKQAKQILQQESSLPNPAPITPVGG